VSTPFQPSDNGLDTLSYEVRQVFRNQTSFCHDHSRCACVCMYECVRVRVCVHACVPTSTSLILQGDSQESQHLQGPSEPHSGMSGLQDPQKYLLIGVLQTDSYKLNMSLTRASAFPRQGMGLWNIFKTQCLPKRGLG
jgi:hypothetical protein